jgi:hypothetical protein
MLRVVRKKPPNSRPPDTFPVVRRRSPHHSPGMVRATSQSRGTMPTNGEARSRSERSVTTRLRQIVLAAVWAVPIQAGVGAFINNDPVPGRNVMAPWHDIADRAVRCKLRSCLCGPAEPLRPATQRDRRAPNLGDHWASRLSHAWSNAVRLRPWCRSRHDRDGADREHSSTGGCKPDRGDLERSFLAILIGARAEWRCRHRSHWRIL